ncbi:Uncharacterized protein RNJ44_00572 [Nakaseomyces bracarensis]|uniref:Mitochondrial genome maintenance protein MGM101 n=1 Tax=Nakaseomyces bracarensis TaxID=273131 RepID=A0ABR4NSY7_9SACH
MIGSLVIPRVGMRVVAKSALRSGASVRWNSFAAKAPIKSSVTKDLALNGKVLEPAEPQAAAVAVTTNSTSSSIDWYSSWHGLGSKPFDDTVQKALASSLAPTDIEIKPDGLIYLPEIKYRRVLNKAFGAGGWGLVPRSQTIVTPKLVTREYGLVCHGQLVSVSRGEQDYFAESGIPTATEGCKSNALMRCCKDLGIGSELWDPVFIKKFKTEYCVERFVTHIATAKKKKIWLRKDRPVEYPYKA